MTEIKEMAEKIATAIVGDTADNEDTQSSIPLATALYKQGYRKRSETVKEFAGEATKAINYEWDNYNTKDKPDTYWRGKRNGLFTAINIINELAEQFGKENE